MAMANRIVITIPLIILLFIIYFFFVLKMPKDIGIYSGWVVPFVFLILSIFTARMQLVFMAISLVIYIAATVLRIDKNKKIKIAEKSKLSEIEKMSISDL